MEVVTSPAEMHTWRSSVAGSVGLVPTMGFLHQGHLSLVAASRERDDATVVSIFVNPAQFGPEEDFARYPRDEARDLALLAAAGVAAVYLPPVAAIYPPRYQTSVQVEEVTRRLEGERRPGHFRGVATVVLKLFNAVQPGRAYFGRKDAQQLRVIQQMVRDLDLALEVVPCPTVREPDGVAMSSRNVYLSQADRAAAPVIVRALGKARSAWEAGERDASALRAVVKRRIAREPLASIDYISLADDLTLEELEGVVVRPALLSVVVRFGRTRLVDNLELA